MAASASLFVCGVLVVALLAAGAQAQLGSVHCRVGCACSEEYRPVCGNDLVTYTNECKLRCRQCDFEGLAILYNGACLVSPPAPLVEAVVPAAPAAVAAAPAAVAAAPAAVAAAPAAVPVVFSPPVAYRPPFYPYPVNYIYAK